VALNGVEINEIGEDTLNLNLSLNISNPTSIAGLLTNLSFHVHSGGEYLGCVRTGLLSLKNGSYEMNVSAVLTPASSVSLRGLVGDLLNGQNASLRITGDPDNSSAFIGSFISGLEFNLSLHSSGVLSAELIDISVDRLGTDDMDVNCTLRVWNPTDITGILTNLSFDVYYNGSFLHTADFKEVSLKKGVNILSLKTTVRPQDNHALSDMAGHLLSGENITLHAQGSQANSSAFLPNIMEGLGFNLTVNSTGTLEIQAGNMSLISAEEDSLELLLDMRVFNPTEIRVALGEVYFDVSAGGEKVGTARLIPLVMKPGWNNAQAEMTLKGERAALEAIVSNYINGQDQNFNVQPASNISDTLIGGIISGLNESVTLPGIREPLITDVKVRMLSVSISPLSLEAHVEVKVHNPTAFSIRVEELNYDVHYDDNDPSGIPFVVSYPAKYNIYLDTVNQALVPAKEVKAGKTTSFNATIHSNSLEHCVRLNDEYNVDNDLVAHVYGTMKMKVGAFEMTVDFTQKNIRVPRG